MSAFRIGHGYDVHRLTKGRRLVIGGVEIKHDRGLLGHSDADVLLHAIMDAILGAMALGDIGRHFPDADMRYKDIASTELLFEVVKKMRNNGYSVSNVDATVVLEKPKVMPYIQEMIANIASILGVDVSDVNVKATTEEHLGFTGREEGIAAHAVVLLEKNKG